MVTVKNKNLWGWKAEHYENMLRDLSSKFNAMYVLFQIGSRRQNLSIFLMQQI
jgi:hypothetical protein